MANAQPSHFAAVGLPTGNLVRHLLIIEPNLRAPSGHYAEFVRALGARVEGEPVDVFAHPAADVMLGQMEGVSVCSREPRVGKPGAEWRTIYRAVKEETPFLVLTSDGRHAAAVSLAAAMTGTRPTAAALFFHWIPSGLQDAVLHRWSRSAREHAQAIVPTEAIARTLREMGWRNIHHFPYPALAPATPPEPAMFRHLLVAGAARLNKGLDLIAEMTVKWAQEGRTLPLLVQVSKKHAVKHGHREEGYIKMLLSSGYAGLQADETAPDRQGYTARFSGALVLAPYERERFADAVSGVVLDALLHGTPVIATEGTWPGAQVERFGAGITIRQRTADSLSSAIDTVLADWDRYAACACEAARVLAKEHDPRNILKIVSGTNR